VLVYREGPDSDPFSYIYRSSRWLTDYDPAGPFPVWVNLEPTNVCQLDCLFCSRQLSKRPLGYLDLALAKTIFAEMAAYKGAAVRLSGWGEPLLHPKISEIVALAKQNGLKVKIYTNGLALTSDLMDLFIDVELDDLQFSFQGLNPTQYENNRVKASFPVLRDNIFLAANKRGSKKRPFLSLLTSVLADELVDDDPALFIKQWLKTVDKVAVDLTNLNFVGHSPRVKPHLSRQSGKLKRGLCVDVFLALEVKYDGSIQFCGQDAAGLAEHTIGQSPALSLAEAWVSPAMEAKRAAVGRSFGHESYTVCRNCYHNTSKYDLFKQAAFSEGAS
jgi:pyruvate-formate lyase-activating enzyme